MEVRFFQDIGKIHIMMLFVILTSESICYPSGYELLNNNHRNLAMIVQKTMKNVSNDSLQEWIHSVKPAFRIMALEWFGGAIGGIAAGGAMYGLTLPITEGANSDGPYAVCFTLSLTSAFFGVAGGTTLVGNAITEPNGSFSKACLGVLTYSTISAVFTGIGCGILAALGPGDFTESGFPWWAIVSSYIIGAGIIVPPPMGAMVGYNYKSMGCCCIGGSQQSFHRSSFDTPSLRLQLINTHY